MALGTIYTAQAEDLIREYVRKEAEAGTQDEDTSVFQDLSENEKNEILDLFQRAEDEFDEAEKYAQDNRDLSQRAAYVSARKKTAEEWFDADSDTTPVLEGNEIVIKKKDPIMFFGSRHYIEIVTLQEVAYKKVYATPAFSAFFCKMIQAFRNTTNYIPTMS